MDKEQAEAFLKLQDDVKWLTDRVSLLEKKVREMPETINQVTGDRAHAKATEAVRTLED